MSAYTQNEREITPKGDDPHLNIPLRNTPFSSMVYTGECRNRDGGEADDRCDVNGKSLWARTSQVMNGHPDANNDNNA